jgi:hypothetical protein
LWGILKAKLIALNLLLAAGVGVVVWQARMRVQEAEQVRRAHLANPMKPVTPPPIAPAPKPDQPSAIKYEDVAKKNLFSADRNDDIVVEPPKVVAPKPMPPLPVSTGVMNMPSGVRISLAEKAGEMSRFLHTGESIGEFKIVALDSQNVTFEWDGKQLPRKIEDLMDRSNQQTAANARPAAGNAPAGGPAAPPPAGAGQQLVNNHPTAANVGTVLTESARACKPDDTSPAGSVVDGFKKVTTQSIFGPVCRWIKQ